MARLKTGPSKRARRMSCTGVASPRNRCWSAPRSWWMDTRRRTDRTDATAGILRSLTGIRCSWVRPGPALRPIPRTRRNSEALPMKVKAKSYAFLAVLVPATILAIGIGEMTVIGQAPANSSATPSTFKTPWGKPDLQGTWSSAGIVVPFQRAKEFGDRQFMTEAEHKKALDELM